MSSKQSSPSSPTSASRKCCSPWSESVYEAADMVKCQCALSCRDVYAAVRRKLLSSPEKDDLTPEEGDNALDSPLPRRFQGKWLYPSQVKFISAKLSLNSGREHFSSSGKLRKARALKSSCHESCNRCEVPRLTTEERLDIFNTFWSLANHERQWVFIFGSVKTSCPRRKSAIAGTKGERHFSRVYHFTVNGKRRRVCKTMFKNTLCICDSWIVSALSHFSAEGFTPDLRGKREETFSKATARTLKHC